MEPDFSGYVSKANLQCTDGRTIAPGAFKHQDGMRVPVVYNHNHTDIAQNLGYAILSHRDDGTWGDPAKGYWVDPDAVGLGDYGRPEGFMQRQVEGWIGRYERARTDDIPQVDPLIRRIRSSVPSYWLSTSSELLSVAISHRIAS